MGDGVPLPAAFSLDEFFEPTSLPLDLFDLQHLHNSGASEKFLPAEKRGMRSSSGSVQGSSRETGTGNGDCSGCPPHPPMLAPPVLHLLRFAMVSLQRLPCGLEEDAVRERVTRRFAE